MARERGRSGPGGILGREWIVALGRAATLGIGAETLLRANMIERTALLAAAVEAHAYQQARDETLARRIVHELIEALKRGRRR